MSEYIHKGYNVTVLLYHLVFPTKYRRIVFDDSVDEAPKEICLDIADRYQIKFLEIGTDEDHVHFWFSQFRLISVTKIVRLTKSTMARELFRRHPKAKK